MSYETYNRSIIVDIIKAREAKPLDSEFEIEDCIAYINEIDKKIEFLDGLKRKRIQDVDHQVDILEERKELLKQTISKTLKNNNKTSLSFPGVGKVSIKTTPKKWIVMDEDEIIEILKKQLKDEEYNTVVTPSVVKSELNKVLTIWDISGWEVSDKKMPSCIKKEDGKEVVSVTVDKKIDEIYETKKDAEIVDTITSPQDEFDRLEDVQI